MEATEIKEGMKVHYTSPHGSKENGIVKSFSENKTIVFVVYHCDNEWENYKNYTGAATNIQDLTAGWAQ